MEFISWLTLVDLSAVSEKCQQELCEVQQDESVKTLFKIKGTTIWLSEELEKKNPHSNTLARQKLKTGPFKVKKNSIFFCVSGSYVKKFKTQIALL